VRAESNLETTSRALGNSKAVADRHYVKPTEVPPDVGKAVNDAVPGLTFVQPLSEFMSVSHRKVGGDDETRTRDLCRDRAAKSCNYLKLDGVGRHSLEQQATPEVLLSSP